MKKKNRGNSLQGKRVTTTALAYFKYLNLCVKYFEFFFMLFLNRLLHTRPVVEDARHAMCANNNSCMYVVDIRQLLRLTKK